MHTGRNTHCATDMELRRSHVVSNRLCLRNLRPLTCISTSSTVIGAGLTSVISCAAADVMSNPADCMAGCMRGASDSKLNGDSGEGKVNELAVTTASICSTDDCIILARVFNSTKASCKTLR